MHHNSIPSDKPFLSIGTNRNVALTSLDKYLGSSPRTDDLTNQNSSPNIQTNDADTILSLQREQNRLLEELDAERRRSESLKETYTKSLAKTASEQREKLIILKHILESESDNSYIKESLKLIGNIEEDQENTPNVETPRVNELAQKAKEAELRVEKQRDQNQKLKEVYRAQRDEIAQLTQDLEDINAQIEAAQNSMQELREKSNSIKESAKKKQQAWKERIAQLEAQLLEQ